MLLAVVFLLLSLTVVGNSLTSQEYLRAQERPATLILTVISGFRITRACHVYNRDAETGN